MDRIVRLVEEKDWGQLTILMGGLRAELSTLYPLAPWSDTATPYVEKIRRTLRENEGSAFVLEQGGSICGYGLGWVSTENDFESRKDRLRYGRIEELYVSTESRQNGIGTAILTALMANLKSKNISHITLGVLNNNAPALAFYRRAGFESYFSIMKTDFQKILVRRLK